MKWLVTGGAGFLGVSLNNYLVNKRHQVVSLDIARIEPEGLRGKVKEVVGSILDRQLLEQAMAGCDVVVHCAAALPRWPREEIERTNVEGTLNVIEAAKKLGINRVVFISTTAIYGAPKVNPVKEDGELLEAGPYAKSKILAEKLCIENRDRLCIPILRPKTFIGPGRLGIFDVLFDWVRRGKNVPIIGSGKNRYQLLHVDDLCEAIFLAATKPAQVANDTFNLGAEEFTTMKEDFQALLDYAGFGKKIVPFPRVIVVPALRVLEKLNLSPMYQWVYETADKDCYVSSEKIKAKLGWMPKKSNKEALIDSYQWYLENYKEYENKPEGRTHNSSWSQGVLALLRDYVF